MTGTAIDCAFCPVYKRARFSRRSVDEVLADLDAMHAIAEDLRARSRSMGHGGEIVRPVVESVLYDPTVSDARRRMAVWLMRGGKTVFLQDSDALVIKPEAVEAILAGIRSRFPHVSRITSYSRSKTLVHRSTEQLRRLGAAGLSRIHVGMESGADEVLERVRKGVTAAEHIEGCRHVVEAGVGLSLYVMPGLGGQTLSERHATETARVVNAIRPDFVRIRTTAVTPGTPLAEQADRGSFVEMDDIALAAEIRAMLGRLDDFPFTLASDHVMNLLEEVSGRWPEDRPRILDTLDTFLGLDRDEQRHFVLGRRVLVYRDLADRLDPARRAHVERVEREMGPLGDDDFRGLVRRLRARTV
jgi:hypothetical protein